MVYFSKNSVHHIQKPVYITFIILQKLGPEVLGIWGEGLFIFRELGSTANYFRGAGEQAHTFGELGSTVKK